MQTTPTIFTLKFNINFTNMQVDCGILCIFFTIFNHDVVYSAWSIRLAIKSIIKNKSEQKKDALLGASEGKKTQI